MKWQDWVLSIGNIIIAIALIPTVLGPSKPAILTSIITATVLYTFGVCFFTLKLKLSCFTVGIAATLWVILLIQGVIQ